MHMHKAIKNKYIYDKYALEMLRKNKEKLQITNDLARTILKDLYPFKYPVLSEEDLQNLSADAIYALTCINDQQKQQLLNMCEWLGWKFIPDWEWQPPSQTQRRSTPYLTDLLSQLLAISNTESPSLSTKQ
jgi:hypothetical protein